MTLPQVLLALVCALPVRAQETGLEALALELRQLRDSAEPELLDRIVDVGTREAAEVLIEAYDLFGSVYLKREVVRSLGRLVPVPAAQQIALVRIANVATGSPERELRQAAIDVLGESGTGGKPFLRMIVEAPAPDATRERALERHVAQAEDTDHGWYRSLWVIDEGLEKAEKQKEREAKKRAKSRAGDGEPEAKVHRLESLRALAFESMVEALADKELVDGVEDRNHDIRRASLTELQRRESSRTDKLARHLFERNDGEEVETRVLAARILVDESGSRAAKPLLAVAEKFVTPELLRLRLAGLLGELRDPGTDKKLVRELDADETWLRAFALRATSSLEGAKVDEALLETLEHEDPELRVLAAQILAQRGARDAAPAVEARLAASSDELEASRLIRAVSILRQGDAQWEERLLAFLDDERTLLRNAALAELTSHPDLNHLERLTGLLQHDDWSTRLAAVRALEALHSPMVIGPLIDGLADEKGRMKEELARCLWRLTGQPFRTAHGNWDAWWKEAARDFELVGPEALEQLKLEEEARRLKHISTSGAKFFGVRLETERVLFVVDVSGSMGETLRGEHYGERARTRIEVAKEELAQCVENLSLGAFFNFVTFSGGVSTWLSEGAAAADGRSRKEALEWIALLGAGGGTNLYGALEVAFADPDVDTIVVLSDGEPSTGEIIDPHAIRASVAAWNEHRGVVLHAISVGTPLQILEWLAEDSGGSHVRIE